MLYGSELDKRPRALPIVVRVTENILSRPPAPSIHVIPINPLTKIPKVPVVILFALAKCDGRARPGKLFGVY
jgi:hypothetical protein